MAEILHALPERVRQYEDHIKVVGDVLEIGTGSGVLAAMCIRKGARSVLAVDINQHAVDYVLANLPAVTSFKSDLFENVNGCFDTIIFAAPWSVGEILRPFDYALYDNGVVQRFFREVEDYLSSNGTIWLQYCDAFEENFIQLPGWIQDGGFKIDAQWAYQTYGQLVNRQVNVILYKITRTI
jgi:methylase of polypeptide subunit release factors